MVVGISIDLVRNKVVSSLLCDFRHEGAGLLGLDRHVVDSSFEFGVVGGIILEEWQIIHYYIIEKIWMLKFSIKRNRCSSPARKAGHCIPAKAATTRPTLKRNGCRSFKQLTRTNLGQIYPKNHSVAKNFVASATLCPITTTKSCQDSWASRQVRTSSASTIRKLISMTWRTNLKKWESNTNEKKYQ